MIEKLLEANDQFFNIKLNSVHELIFNIPDEVGPEMREGLILEFENFNIVIHAASDTSELIIHTGILEPYCKPDDSIYYFKRDISNKKPFKTVIGKSVRNWWEMKNNQGYSDGFIISFEEDFGICFIAINNDISILTVSGEQMS